MMYSNQEFLWGLVKLVPAGCGLRSTMDEDGCACKTSLASRVCLGVTLELPISWHFRAGFDSGAGRVCVLQGTAGDSGVVSTTPELDLLG